MISLFGLGLFLIPTFLGRLPKALAPNLLQGVQFYIFCLGDRAYGPQKFCSAGRKLIVRLQQLGAELLDTPGYGDDGTPNGGVFMDLDQWLQTAFPMLNEQKNSRILTLPPAPHHVRILDKLDTAQDHEEWQHEHFREYYQPFFSDQSPLTAYSFECNRPGKYPPLIGTLLENKRLTPNDWEQDTRHIRIEVPFPADSDKWSLDQLPYRAGDVAAIMPSNTEKEVELFLLALPNSVGALADKELTIAFSEDNSSSIYPGASYRSWPSKCTLRGWLLHCADIHALPEREDLRALSFYCSDTHEFGSDQRAKLVSLSETKGSALYADYILREKRSWTDVLYDFDSLRHEGSRLTVESLLGLMQPMRPREFSIASAPTQDWESRRNANVMDRFHIELLVAVVEGTTRLGRSYHGLCSNYLRQCNAEKKSRLRVWIRPGSFHGLPLDNRPVMCVGAGTGVAPLRALLHERQAVQSVAGGLPDTLLFGCRKKAADFYYRDEWCECEQKNQLVLYTAFSRDEKYKVYVQKILETANKESNLLFRHVVENKGAIFIAGNPKMARAIKEVIMESFTFSLGDEKSARRYLNQLQRSGLYSVEAWG